MSDEQLSKTLTMRGNELALSDVLRGSGGQHSLNHAAEAEKVLGIDPEARRTRTASHRPSRTSTTSRSSRTT